MATLFDAFDGITETYSAGHPEHQLMILWDAAHRVYIVYNMKSGAWCYPINKDEVIEMVMPERASTDGWLVVGMRVELPTPAETARCAVCGWLFWKHRGYYEPGEYAYCAECCQW